MCGGRCRLVSVIRRICSSLKEGRGSSRHRGGASVYFLAVMTGENPALRLLDANANRSREALRVLEDYARFILDDQSLSSELKHLRHDLAALLRPLLPNAILHRDTPGDVGRANKTKTEFTRDSLADVI